MNTAANCIDRVDHIGVRVGDVDEATAFFVDALGFSTLFRGVGPDGQTEVALVALGEVRFELVGRGDGAAGAVLDHIGLRTTGALDEAARQLAQVGIATTGPEVDGLNDSRAIRLDTNTTIGLNMHVSRYPA